MQRVKGTFSDSSGHNILEIFNNLVQVQIVQSKIKIDLLYNNFGTPDVSPVAERIKT